LVHEHLRAAGPLGAGLSALPGVATAFASTQAAWRFYANPRVTLPALAEPLLAAARRGGDPDQPPWALVVHDRSALKYPGHRSKADQTTLSHPGDRGYELTTALLVDAANGAPVAPLEIRLRAEAAVYSTRQPAPDVQASWLDELLPAMRAATEGRLGYRLVHVIDAEADSVGHYRAWAQAGQTFLVRADPQPHVRWEGQDLPLGEVAERLAARGAFACSRDVDYHGRPARQEVAQTEVALRRPAWRNRRKGAAGHGRVPGPPLALRLVVSRVFTADGQLAAQWLLLTNTPAEVLAAQVALWYYWRWRTESYYKLLKSAGQQLERWQQETAEAVAKRLVVASMACVVVWRLARAAGPQAARAREVLTRLSGRQMKWGVAYTEPALLAGLWVLLAALAALDHYSEAELRAIKGLVRPGDDTG
jgi:hypothetical protein